MSYRCMAFLYTTQIDFTLALKYGLTRRNNIKSCGNHHTKHIKLSHAVPVKNNHYAHGSAGSPSVA